MIDTVTLAASNNWEGTFENLPESIKGKVTMEEESVSGWSSSISDITDVKDDATSMQATITNTAKSTPPTPSTGSITVTKNTFVNGKSRGTNLTFYAALFNTSGSKVSDVKAITMNGNISASVTFTGLKVGETYVVYETDKDGNKITDATKSGYSNLAEITYDNQNVALSASSDSGRTSINNYFSDTPKESHGQVKITKKVTVDGKGKATSNSYYVALFSDKNCTDRVTDVKTLSMNGKDSTAVTFLTDKDGAYLVAGKTYYLSETDKTGKAITNAKDQLGCKIDYSSQKVMIDTGSQTGKATITNQYTNKVRKYNPPHKTTTTNTAKTGDNANDFLWMMLAGVGIAGMAGVLAGRKRKSDK